MTLPEITFADADVEAMETLVINKYESITGTTLQPADPVRLFLETLAYVCAVQANLIDLAGKQNLLSYATGAHLDHLGELMGVERLAAQAATCTVTFSIASALTFDVPIPAGTRIATKDGSIVFSTLASATIAAGDLSCDATAQAETAGEAVNGLVAGQLCVAVDSLPYVTSVSNSTVTSYGSDAEDDDRLRDRIRQAPESFTCAGPAGMYQALTLAVSESIEEVVVTSPTPGTVEIRFTVEGGELPDDALMEKVRVALASDDVRPLTDNVTVKAPDTVEYSIEGQWFLSTDDSTMLTSVTDAVAAAVETYRVWQRSKPGRDINPTKLISLVEQAGACRVALATPVFTELSSIQVARETSVSLTFGGLEDN